MSAQQILHLAEQIAKKQHTRLPAMKTPEFRLLLEMIHFLDS